MKPNHDQNDILLLDNNEMNVAIGIDKNYIDPAIVMVVSLLENNESIVKLYILHNKLNYEDIRKFELLLKKYHYKNEVISIRVKMDWGESAPKYAYIPIETYLNVVAPNYLPSNIDRVLYLDPDIIINKSIVGFYNQELEGVCIVAARDQYITDNDRDFRNNLNIKGYTDYINAGVILFNLELCRKEVNIDWYMNQLDTTFKGIRYANQDLLNIMYDNRIRICSSNYNYQVHMAPKKRTELRNIEKSVYIFHFNSWKKPWKLPYPGKFDYIYWKYSLIAGNGDEYIKYMKQKYISLLLWETSRIPGKIKMMIKKIVNLNKI